MRCRTGLTALVIMAASAVFPEVLVTAQVREADVRDSAAEAAARQALERFITRWNSGDDVQLRDAMHFPFVSVTESGSVVIDIEPDDFTAGFEQMRSGRGWTRSAFDFDSFTVIKSSPEKVHAEIDFARYGADGSAYLRSRVFYIVTKEDERWAVKLRTRAAPAEALSDQERDEIVRGGRQAVLDFFTAFNAGDSEGSVRTLHHPHLFLTANGGFAIAENAADGPRPDFDQMRGTENWHVSTIDAIDASVVTPNKVHFELRFTRWHPDGTRYWTVPALWIVTRAGDQWGIQVRSLMPATFDAR